jgi:hypothetical protein
MCPIRVKKHFEEIRWRQEILFPAICRLYLSIWFEAKRLLGKAIYGSYFNISSEVYLLIKPTPAIAAISFRPSTGLGICLSEVEAFAHQVAATGDTPRVLTRGDGVTLTFLLPKTAPSTQP